MRSSPSLGVWSLAAGAAFMVLTQTFQPMVLIPLIAGQNAAWLAVLIATVISIAGWWPLGVWLARRPGTNLMSLMQSAVGRYGTILLMPPVFALGISHAGLSLRGSSETAVSALYPHTPQTFAMTELAALALGAAWIAAPQILRLCRVVLPWLAFGLFAIVLGTFGWGKLTYLVPWLGPGLLPLLSRSVLVASLFTPATLTLAWFSENVSERRHLLPLAGAVAIGASGLLTAILKVALVMAFPPPLGYSIPTPLYAMTRLVMGGRFFERVDAMWLFLWVVTSGISIGITIRATALNFCQAFGIPDQRDAILPVILMVVAFALAPTDMAEIVRWRMGYFNLGFGLVGSLAVPIALIPIANWREGRKRRAK